MLGCHSYTTHMRSHLVECIKGKVHKIDTLVFVNLASRGLKDNIEISSYTMVYFIPCFMRTVFIAVYKEYFHVALTCRYCAFSVTEICRVHPQLQTLKTHTLYSNLFHKNWMILTTKVVV